ncbi:MAG: thiamine phosphate synthase [Alphaproteobacteria bacterium CG_4_10_14_0_2_um_filter_63_37]|nr:MAG: thiamine phosphate synthase [Alphaproteobacteria bacterium CG_4_10_14_0_2_um_filter_63_37]
MWQRRVPPPLELISDCHVSPNWERRLEQALSGGAPWINLRNRDLPPTERRDMALRLRDLTRRFDALLTISGDEALAAQVGADGLHLTSIQDPTPMRSRHPDWLLIASTHNADEIARAVAGGVDAVTLSPVFATRSHPEAQPLGLDRFRALIRGCPVPVYGLGGVNLDNLDQVMSAGAAGVSMIRGGVQSEDPAQAARMMLNKLNLWRMRQGDGG